MEKVSRKALGIIFLTVFIDLIGFGIIIPLSPYLARQFQATPFQVGLLMSVFSLMQFVFSPVWGKISDRVGRRPIILMSLLGSTLSYIGFAYAETLTGLFVSRIFAGIFGASISTAMAYIADVTTEENRSKGMGMIGAAFGLGFIFGPFIGGIFGHYGESLGSTPPFGMSFAALAAAAICGLNFLLALKVLKESLPKEKRGQSERFKTSRFVLLFSCLQRPILGPLLFVFFLSSLAMAHMESTLFLLVKDRFDWDVRTASYGFAYVGLVIAFTQGYLIRKLMPKFGEAKVMFVGLLLAALGMYGLGASPVISLLAIAVTALALGNGMSNPATLGGISLKADAGEQGVVMGVGQSLSALGRIIGPAIGGWVYGNLSIEAPFYIAGGLMALALCIVISIFAKIPQKGKEGLTPDVA